MFMGLEKSTSSAEKACEKGRKIDNYFKPDFTIIKGVIFDFFILKLSTQPPLSYIFIKLNLD